MRHSASMIHACGSFLVLSAVAVSACSKPQEAPAPPEKVPITTASEEARTLYLEGRDLAEKLRATDARQRFEQAVAKDPAFALAYFGLATTAGTTKEFVEATTKAASLAANASEGERHMILGLEAGMKNDPAGQERHYTQLVGLFPNDERAHGLLGNLYFGRQDYATAVKHYSRSVELNPSYSAAYNQLGYAHRFLGQVADAEKAFQKYIELIPNDPNPYDSYAELLMKTGRFEESIANYQKALSIEPTFVASYVGIANNQIFLGRIGEARETLGKLASAARNTGERRLAHFWTAASYVHEGASAKALEELGKAQALAEADGDMGSVSGDLNQMGDVLREAGQPDQALAKYVESVAAMDKAAVPDEVKAAARRNHLFEEARVALVKKDLATAKAKAAEYAAQVATRNVPFEVRQQHELAGLIAEAEGRHAEAVSELERANQQDPRVLYLTALASQGAGNADRARELAAAAANFNGLSFNYGYVRAKAGKLAGT